jgi:outer membrane protein assembly factor BamD
MLRRTLVLSLLLCLCASLAQAGIVPFRKKKDKKKDNPLADVNSKQPDKVLFDRATAALAKNRFDIARVTLQTLINTYPDSEYVARAKLAIADAWYKEGGSAGLAQAEIEYKDFITFFPNMPEAAEAQMKVGDIHYKQMEKPDRDYTHAKRAEEEYKAMIEQFPDSSLLPKAKQKLRDVQEVLAEREFRVGRFYYLRESYPAAIARLKTLTDTYPLYSRSEESLMMLGDMYEKQMNATKVMPRLPAAARERLMAEWGRHAEETYDHLITRYPLSSEADSAKKRLQAMGRPVPTATPEQVAEYKAEEQSRGHAGMVKRTRTTILSKHPDMSVSAKTGEPTMTEPPPTSAPGIYKEMEAALRGEDPTKVAEKKDEDSTSRGATSGGSTELTLSPVTNKGNSGVSEAPPTSAPAEAPTQVNEAAADGSAAATDKPATATTDKDKKEDKNVSTSKKKEKHGLRKLIPF